MKQELYDEMSRMCDDWQISAGVECMILELMEDAYHNGWEDGRKEKDE